MLKTFEKIFKNFFKNIKPNRNPIPPYERKGNKTPELKKTVYLKGEKIMENITAYIIIATVIATIVSVLGWVIKTRNRFEKLRNAVDEESSNISVFVEKYNETISDAMNIANVSHRNEVAGMQSISGQDKLDQLAYLGQRYPELGCSPIYQQIVKQGFILREDISASKVLLNSNISAYTEAINDFPGNVVAGIFGYKKEVYIDHENLMENRKVSKKTVDFAQF